MEPSGRLHSRVLGTLEDIEAVAADWRRLDAHCADPLSYFQSYDWCRRWVETFSCGHQPYVVTIWDGDLLVALWPGMIVDGPGLRRLETLGVPHSQYCGLLLRRGAVTPAEVAEVLGRHMRQSGCDVVVSRAVPHGSALAQVLADEPVVPGTDNVASWLDLSPYGTAEDYTAQLGKLQKRNRNRRRNHLARLGKLHFEVIWPDHSDFAELVRQCTEMKRRWLSETGRMSVGFAMQGYEDFLARLDGDEAALSGACLSVLRAGDRIVAMELGFLQRRHYYAYIGGFDWDLRDLSPGKVQMECTVGWLIDHGAMAYDLLINPADYKASWTSTSVSVSTKARALTWRGRVYASAWIPSVRPALKRFHRQLPVIVERVVGWLRPAVCLLLYV